VEDNIVCLFRKPEGHAKARRVRLPRVKLFRLFGYWRSKGFEVGNIVAGRLFIKKIG